VDEMRDAAIAKVGGMDAWTSNSRAQSVHPDLAVRADLLQNIRTINRCQDVLQQVG